MKYYIIVSSCRIVGVMLFIAILIVWLYAYRIALSTKMSMTQISEYTSFNQYPEFFSLSIWNENN